MTFRFDDIGENFQHYSVYLNESDYGKLFNNEIAFGKLLKVFARLVDAITRDPDKLRSWITDDRYADFVKSVKKINDIVGEQSYDT